MKKIVLLLALLTWPVSVTLAQTADLAGAISGDMFEKEESKKTPKAEEQKESDEKVADDRGIFSFLNFSFIQKPLSFFSSDDEGEKSEDADTSGEGKNTESQKKETPLEKTIRLAEEGNTDAAMTLGYMYLYGQDGVARDNAKAFYFYELAAKTGDPIALNNLGSLYFNGIGVEADYSKAIKLFEVAAQKGNNDAAVNLAFIYLTSDDDTQNEQAVNLLIQAEKSGNNTAKFMLGYAFYKGFIVPQDFKRAIALLSEAAKAGFDESYCVLAQMYANGEGTAQNYSTSVAYYREAIGQGHVESMMTLAKILAEGRMTPQNLIQAHILYNIASVFDAPNAVENRNIIEKNLKLEELLQAQNAAASYRANPSELTNYIRQTFGNNIRRYIDVHQKKESKRKVEY